MALESSTFINGLVASNPTSSDNISDGDNHIRLLKSTVKATFPNVTGAVSGTHTDINSAVTAANAATNANTASTIVKRDGSGNFTAGTVTAALIGNVTGSVTGNVTGSAGTAGRWTTARTITLGGDLSGNVSIRGDANVTLTATVADDSHNHVIDNIDGLQTALDGKVDDSQVLTNVPENALFTDTNTTYSIGDGGLTQKNFTTTLKTKLDGIEANATADQTASEIVGLAAGCNAGSVDGFSISTSQSGSNANTIYFRT
tara:strand:+ start:3404 stop:4180 length:777 start_codon:yes stop_codon:yes gene_type:complete